MTISIDSKEAQSQLQAAVDAAGRLIPPAWPLAATVAVNPFLGHTGDTLAVAGERIGRISGSKITMPREWYRERIADGRITDADLTEALASCGHAARPGSIAELKGAAATDSVAREPLATVADLAARATAKDWTALVQERFTIWASGYFDAGQALWAAPKPKSAFGAWRGWATNDLTPEIHGLAGFARFVADAPATATGVIKRATKTLGLTPAAYQSYFHQLLFSLGGWAQTARYNLWQAELAGETDNTLRDLLAIRLLWEEALYRQHQARIETAWQDVLEGHAAPLVPDDGLVIDSILQEAAERAAQRDLITKLEKKQASIETLARPRLQAAFCIDVRSEVFRRALESIDPSTRTVGFAGFFGVFASHRRFASDVDEHRLPVLLNPTVHSCAGGDDQKTKSKDRAKRYAARAKRAWGRFKLAAVSSFAFVEAMGPVYAWKLARDAFGYTGKSARDEPMPRLDPELDAAAQIDAAETVLRAMSLTRGFARVVLLAGHGANVVNNPHASALHCGACGGHAGDVNARLLAQLLNNDGVRDGLRGRGIEIPEDTLFVAALHDTTTDRVKLYEDDVDTSEHRQDLAQVRRWLLSAGQQTRAERALRLPGATWAADVAARASDWAQVRPEWALAGCQAFIAAPRSRTSGRNLEGRAFLHDYDWRLDQERGFPVLELILTAPVVVASWISLQYYGSATAPESFGAGNKLLHNVVGGIGVLEGNGGVMRAGLPWQSVHDGETFAHEPLRLTVVVEAPTEAMSRILERHPGVRELFDNGWLHLMALDAQGRVAARYVGDLGWESVGPAEVLAA